MSTTLKLFTTDTPTLSQDVAVAGDAWKATCDKPQTFRLFEVPAPGVEAGTVSYRAKLKTEGLTGRAYLEMWCRFPGRGEFFSKGLNNMVTGNNDWISCEIPFLLQKGERPDLIRLHLSVAAAGLIFKKAVTGKIWIKDIALAFQPSP